MPYKQEVGGSIPPCPNDIIILVKIEKISDKKLRDVKLGIKKDATRGANDEAKHGVDMVGK